MVLVRDAGQGRVAARAANLRLDTVEAGSQREAISRLVSAARRALASADASDALWIRPAAQREPGECIFRVPFHL